MYFVFILDLLRFLQSLMLQQPVRLVICFCCLLMLLMGVLFLVLLHGCFLVTPHWDAVACYSDVGDCGEWVRDGCICDMCVDRYVYMIF